jgi:uncharacterized protein
MRLKWKDIVAKQGNAVKVEEQMDMSSYIKDTADLIRIEPLHVDLSATLTSGLVEVKGHLHTDATLQCSKCLKTFVAHLDVPFREMYSDIPPTNGDDEDIHLVTGQEIDLMPEVEQNFMLAIPYIPTCSEECQGLCPVCGKNRNEEACGCKQEKVDPRLAGLADFFNKE